MPEPIQTPEDVRALVRNFRISGRVPLSLDETVVPVVVLRDLSTEISASGGAVELPTTNELLTSILAAIQAQAGGGAGAERIPADWRTAMGRFSVTGDSFSTTATLCRVRAPEAGDPGGARQLIITGADIQGWAGTSVSMFLVIGKNTGCTYFTGPASGGIVLTALNVGLNQNIGLASETWFDTANAGSIAGIPGVGQDLPRAILDWGSVTAFSELKAINRLHSSTGTFAGQAARFRFDTSLRAGILVQPGYYFGVIAGAGSHVEAHISWLESSALAATLLPDIYYA